VAVTSSDEVYIRLPVSLLSVIVVVGALTVGVIFIFEWSGGVLYRIITYCWFCKIVIDVLYVGLMVGPLGVCENENDPLVYRDR